MANANQEHMDADCDCQKDERDKAEGSEKNVDDSCAAAGNYQHGGVSVSIAGAPRNITEGSYLRAEVSLQSVGSPKYFATVLMDRLAPGPQRGPGAVIAF